MARIKAPSHRRKGSSPGSGIQSRRRSKPGPRSAASSGRAKDSERADDERSRARSIASRGSGRSAGPKPGNRRRAVAKAADHQMIERRLTRGSNGSHRIRVEDKGDAKLRARQRARSRGMKPGGASGRDRSVGTPTGRSTRSIRAAEGQRRPVSKRRSPKETGRS
jgi:hypothetical protein